MLMVPQTSDQHSLTKISSTSYKAPHTTCNVHVTTSSFADRYAQVLNFTKMTAVLDAAVRYSGLYHKPRNLAKASPFSQLD